MSKDRALPSSVHIIWQNGGAARARSENECLSRCGTFEMHRFSGFDSRRGDSVKSPHRACYLARKIGMFFRLLQSRGGMELVNCDFHDEFLARSLRVSFRGCSTTRLANQTIVQPVNCSSINVRVSFVAKNDWKNREGKKVNDFGGKSLRPEARACSGCDHVTGVPPGLCSLKMG